MKIQDARRLIVAAPCVAAVVLAGCSTHAAASKAGPAPAKTTVLTLAAGPSGNGGGVQPFVDLVAKLSGGALRIDVQGGRSDGNPNWETLLLTDVQAGKVQIGVTGSRAFDTIGINTFTALQAPMLIDSVALEQRVIASPIAADMLNGLTPHGLVGLGLWAGGLRRPLGITHPLLGLSDYKNARITIGPSKTTEAIVSALGAIPTTDTDGVDGVEAGVLQLASGDYPNGATLTSNVILQARPSVLVINSAAWSALPKESRDLLQQAATQYASTGFVYDEPPLVAELCRKHVAVVPASPQQLADLQAKFRPVYDALRLDAPTSRFIAQIEALKAQDKSPPDVVASCPPQPSSSAAASTPLDGSWHTSFTEAEFNKAGAIDENDPLNWGAVALTFNHGHFQLLKGIGDTAVPNWSGSYAVTGSTVTLAAGTGETATFLWSIYKDQLTFKNPPGQRGPTSFIVKPWLRDS